MANNYGFPGSETEDRRQAAYQAFYEHQPVRSATPQPGTEVPLYRSFGLGNLATLHLLDTRRYRTDLGCPDGETGPCSLPQSSSKSMLGPTQEAWLSEQLQQSTSRWNIVASSVVFSDLSAGVNYNEDQWDGFLAQRARLSQLVSEQKTSGFVVLSGDRHAAALASLHATPGRLVFSPLSVRKSCATRYPLTATRACSTRPRKKHGCSWSRCTTLKRANGATPRSSLLQTKPP